MKEHQDVPDLMEGYDRIHSGKTYSLYRRKRDNSADELWQDSEQVNFGFQPHNAPCASESLVVSQDNWYNEQGYGWVTHSERGDDWNNASAETPDRDFVSGRFDGVFKADLPNGQCAVTVQFAADPAVTFKPVRGNLIANDKNVISNLAIPVGTKLIKQAYQVDVSNGHLT